MAKPRNKEKDKVTAKAYYLARRRYLDALKAVPCMDCGQNFPPCAMDFDHVRGEKMSDVGELCNRSWERLITEIAKCEIVCANCHRIRTDARKTY